MPAGNLSLINGIAMQNEMASYCCTHSTWLSAIVRNRRRAAGGAQYGVVWMDGGWWMAVYPWTMASPLPSCHWGDFLQHNWLVAFPGQRNWHRGRRRVNAAQIKSLVRLRCCCMLTLRPWPVQRSVGGWWMGGLLIFAVSLSFSL